MLHTLDHIIERIQQLRRGEQGAGPQDDSAIAGYLAGYCTEQVPQAFEELAVLRESLRWRDRVTDPPPLDAQNGRTTHLYDFCGKWWRPMPSPYPPDDPRSQKDG